MIVSTKEHYDCLIDEGNDPFRDNDLLKSYMSKWDGPKFYEMLELTSDKSVLEVGVGTGRIAENVLRYGCIHFTGIDISPKTIVRARENLIPNHEHVELLLQEINSFDRKNTYDIIYSVLTFIHIEDKEKALSNMVEALKPEGIIVLSISSKQDNFLDCGRKVRVFPQTIDFYCKCLESLNCSVDKVTKLYDEFTLPGGEKTSEYGQQVATLIKATNKIVKGRHPVGSGFAGPPHNR